MTYKSRHPPGLGASTLLPLWQRWVLILTITLGIGSVLVELRERGVLEPVELLQYDWTTSAIASPRPVQDVQLVAISDRDLGEWGWPVPDDKLTQLTQAVLAAGASAVGIDIYRDVPAGTGRAGLLEVLNDPRVFVISKLPDADGTGITAPPNARTGFSDIPIDSDGVARRALLLVGTQDGVSLSLPLQLAARFADQPALQSDPDNPRFLMFGDTVLRPLQPGSNLFRNADTAGYQITIAYRNTRPIASHVPAAEVLTQTDPARFKGKAVIIGITSHSVKDYFSTPLNRSTGAGFTFGAEIHAAITQQLIDYANGTLSPHISIDGPLSTVLIFASVLAGTCLAVLVRATSKAIVLAGVGVVLLAVGLSAFQNLALLLPVAPSVLGWTFGFLIGFAIIAGLSRRQRRTIVQVFSSHLSDELSSEIWQQRKKLLSGGKPKSRRVFVTALLADIEGSTRTGNAMDAEAFMTWISRILDKLGEVARQHGGFVEKYTGDGILVVFGAPIPSETSEQRQADAVAGLRCAHAMRAAAIVLNKEITDQPQYRLRIALNSGEALGGSLGVSGSMHYNVIGDTINVTARLESWIKSLSPDGDGFRPVCMTQSTADLIDAGANWPVLSSFCHDDGVTQINVINAM